MDLGPSKIFENRNKIKQFIVVCVREPAADGYRVLRVEDVGSRGVVDDDSVPKLTANLREILLEIVNKIVANGTSLHRTNLDVVALVVVTALSEQSMVDHVVNVQLIQQWVAILHTKRVSNC